MVPSVRKVIKDTKAIRDTKDFKARTVDKALKVLLAFKDFKARKV
jgi:hypothetical protein